MDKNSVDRIVTNADQETPIEELLAAAHSAVRHAETLAQINAALSQAVDEQEILASVAVLAEQYHVLHSALQYAIADKDNQFYAAQGVAVRDGNGKPFPLEQLPASFHRTEDYPILKLAFDTPDEPLFVEDAATDPRCDGGDVREFMQKLHHSAVIIMPLRTANQWQGMMTFSWSDPQKFSPETRRLFSESRLNVSSRVASRRAFLAEEATRRRVEVVARLNEMLSLATNEQEILSTIANYVQKFGFAHALLSYVTTDSNNKLTDWTPVVAQAGDGQAVPITTQYDRLPMLAMLDKSPNKPVFVENVLTDPFPNIEDARVVLQTIGISALVLMPLRAGHQWQGLIMFGWSEARSFSDELQQTLHDILPTAAAVVANRRLLTHTELLYRATEEQLQIVVNNAPIILHALSTDGHFTLSEGKGLELLGLKSGELVGQSVADVYGDHPQTQEHLRRALAGEVTTWIQEIGNLAFQNWAIPMSDQFNSITSLVNVAIDITDLQTAEKERESLIRQLREASRFKDEFMAVMSHELRTPLNAMIGLLGIVMMEGSLNEDDTMLVTRARANSERLLNLINNILDISRMEAGRLEIVPSEVAVRQVIQKFQTDMSILATQKHLEFFISIDPLLPDLITIDEDVLNKILTNLVGNAFKFTKQGSVSLSLLRDNEQLIIEVKDTGVGIPAHMQEIIFESFRQVDASSTRAYGGSGLGLAIVRNLCLAMKGTVRVDSKPGAGSTFIVTLPLTVEKIATIQ